jgi:molybdopterin molybdotransferase
VLPFDEARERLLNAARPVGTERVSLRQAGGRILAQYVVASESLPRFDHSAMDGYALRCATLSGPGPWTLPLVGESRAGSEPADFGPDPVCRIFTGAPMPAHADGVVAQEEADVRALGGAEMLHLTHAPRPGQHVRRHGEDVAAGACVLRAGTRLTGFHLGLAAAVDRAELTVYRRPSLVIVSTGDELRLPGHPGGAGSIPESNGVAIAALAESAGAQVTLAPLPGDNPELGQAILAESLRHADLLITIGGVSVGRYDWVKEALSRVGVDLDFWKIAMKPGKPLAFGRLGQSLVLGLPGNPVSAQLTFSLLGLPLVRALQGEIRASALAFEAHLTRGWVHDSPRRGFYRALLDGDAVTPLDNQASGNTASLAEANALIDLPAGGGTYEAGHRVRVLRICDL